MRKIRFAVLILVAAFSLSLRGGPSEVRSGDRLAYALAGARVIVAPGRVIENGVIVVRGGVIEAAGPPGQTAIPADARIFDHKGKVVHAAFIDPYVPADRLMINPDCGLRHLAPDVARQKLRAMVAGVALVRAELPGGQTS